jgi:hypothetical protein
MDKRAEELKDLVFENIRHNGVSFHILFIIYFHAFFVQALGVFTITKLNVFQFVKSSDGTPTIFRPEDVQSFEFRQTIPGNVLRVLLNDKSEFKFAGFRPDVC